MSFSDLQSQINSLFGDFNRGGIGTFGRRRGLGDPFQSMNDPFAFDWSMSPFDLGGFGGWDTGVPLLTSGGDIGIGGQGQQRLGKGMEETKMDESAGPLTTRTQGGQLATRTGAAGLPVLRCRVNVEDTADKYKITAEVPGFDKDNLKVNISDDNMLTISGEQKKEHIEESRDKRYLRTERSFGSVQRSLRLPRNCKKEGVTANYLNGILHVDVPKVQQQQQGTPVQIS